jgi:hypothetical protein
MKGVKRFGVKGKISPRYIGPFPILKKCGSVAYKVELPQSLAGVDDIIHVLQLKKFLKAPVDVVIPKVAPLESDLTYPEHPIEWNRGIQGRVTTVVGRSSRHLPRIAAKEVLEGTSGSCNTRSGTPRVRFDISRASDQDLGPKELCHVIPHSEKEGTKPPYVCPGCSNHTHGNNMINRENVTNKQVLFLT